MTYISVNPSDSVDANLNGPLSLHAVEDAVDLVGQAVLVKLRAQACPFSARVRALCTTPTTVKAVIFLDGEWRLVLGAHDLNGNNWCPRLRRIESVEIVTTPPLVRFTR